MSDRLLGRAFAATLAILLTTCAVAATAPPPDARSVQGLTLSFRPLDGTQVPTDARPARLVALFEAGPSPFIQAGTFEATWEGEVNLKVREKWGFCAEGAGRLTVTIDDNVVLQVNDNEPGSFSVPSGLVRLKKGKNHFKAVYEGGGHVRLYWFQENVPPEPIPPTVFTHDATAPLLANGTRLREGRMLLAEFRCTKCHALPAAMAESPGMPELRLDAPSLADAGARLNRDWMAAWVRNPQALRPTAHMPRMIADDGAAADVAAYLATLQGDRRPEATPDASATDEQVREGAKLFAGLNCIGCHVPPGQVLAKAPATTDPPRVPLDHVAVKFKPGALARFLLNPQAHYAWNPMPDFKLSEAEAHRLAAFLLKHGTKPLPALPPGDVQRGKALVTSAGCVNCHVVQGNDVAHKSLPPGLAAIPKDHWTRGCLADEPAARGRAPDFPLSSEQKQAIAFFATTDGPDFASLGRDSAIEFAERQFVAMRCNACHARDGRESLVASTLAGESAALSDRFLGKDALAQGDAGGPPLGADQRAPMLTWVGEKLRPEWMGDFVAGRVSAKPRPYLRARMPAFPLRAEFMAAGLAGEHGYSDPSPLDDSPIDKDLASIGQRLIGQANGFSCVQCHAVGSNPPLAPFEAPALNFAYVHERLRKPYYDRWMHNPLRVDPDTKMPQYANEGTTAIRDVFEGDAQKQFDAIWEFLRRGKDVK